MNNLKVTIDIIVGSSHHRFCVKFPWYCILKHLLLMMAIRVCLCFLISLSLSKKQTNKQKKPAHSPSTKLLWLKELFWFWYAFFLHSLNLHVCFWLGALFSLHSDLILVSVQSVNGSVIP